MARQKKIKPPPCGYTVYHRNLECLTREPCEDGIKAAFDREVYINYWKRNGWTARADAELSYDTWSMRHHYHQGVCGHPVSRIYCAERTVYERDANGRYDYGNFHRELQFSLGCGVHLRRTRYSESGLRPYSQASLFEVYLLGAKPDERVSKKFDLEKMLEG